MPPILISLDDTDMPDTPGTGKLARHLTAELTARGALHIGTTRHRLLFDPRIPYTGHNRAICIRIDWPHLPASLDFVFTFVRERSFPGSDPGVCIVPLHAFTPGLTLWARRAQTDVLTMDEAATLAAQHQIDLRPLAGTGQGIIGALTAAALHADGNDGHFVDMPGLRELPETLSADHLTSLGITLHHHLASTPIASSPHTYKTFHWIRPRLLGGKPVLPLEWSDHDNAWIPLDRQQNRQKDHSEQQHNPSHPHHA